MNIFTFLFLTIKPCNEAFEAKARKSGTIIPDQDPCKNSRSMRIRNTASSTCVEESHGAGWTDGPEVRVVLEEILLQLGEDVLPVGVLPQGRDVRPDKQNISSRHTHPLASPVKELVENI